METVLGKVEKADIHMEPYPYVLKENAISDELAAELMETFPSLETLAQGKDLGNNIRLDYSANESTVDQNISETWREFIKAHTSQDFFHQIVEKLGDGIRKFHPTLEEKHGPLDTWKVGTRHIDSYEDRDVLIDAQISANTPVLEKPSSVRVCHVDAPEALYGGLLYLRHPNDDSEGGNLQVYKWKSRPKMQGTQWAHPSEMITVGEVPYRANTLVLFINSAYSLHGVTRREPTKHPRRFMNLLGEMEQDVFDYKKHQETFFDKLQRKFLR